MPETRDLPHTRVEWNVPQDLLWNDLGTAVSLDTGKLLMDDGRMALAFPSEALPPHFSRVTTRVVVGVEDFPAILAAMCEVDRERALAAMSGELRKRL